MSEWENVLGDPRHSESRPLRKTDGRLLWKYVRLFIIRVGGALLTSGAIDLFFSFQDQRHALAKAQRVRAVSAAEMIERFLGDIEWQVHQAAKTPRAASNTGLELRRMDYLRLLKHVPAITDLSYLDRTGKEQLRVSRLALAVVGTSKDLSGEKKFQEARAKDIHYSPVYFRNESEPYLTIGVAEQGPNAGVVVAEVNLKFIWDVVSEIRIGKSGQAYVVDSRGILVSHPDISLVLKKTSFSSLPQV